MRALRLEPWCFAPGDIARMTDYEIVHEYIWPQHKRLERLERERKGLPVEDERGEEKSFVPSRGYMLAMLVNLGMTKEQAVAEYERQKKMNDEFQKSR